MKTWTDLGIDVHGKTSGQISTTCPQCSATRRKKHVPCLSINLDEGVFCCHHCNWSGCLKTGEDARPQAPRAPRLYRKPQPRTPCLPDKMVQWFAKRGIPLAVLERRHIGFAPSIYFAKLEDRAPAIAFPYYRNGEHVNTKYRTVPKEFCMDPGCELLFYGLDDVQGDTLIICEGEMDVLALEVAGYTSVVSVPNGAPPLNVQRYETLFQYLLSAEAMLASMRQIILAVDNDEPGKKLAQELARRLGTERCYRVEWSSECKDANDVLMSYGATVLRECIEHAQPWPIQGIIHSNDLLEGMDIMYQHGVTRGLSTGWHTLNDYYTVRTGELTVVTGIPSHGKSSWLSALMVNMAKEHDWAFTVFSPENCPLERYVATLLEISLGKPFDGSPARMSEAEMYAGAAWLNDHVSFLLPEDTSPTVDHLLDLAKTQVLRHGIKGLILDPWNEVEHSRAPGLTETEYISQALTKIRRFARLHDVHVWIVAHPTKLRKAESGEYEGHYPPPTPYDINGSSNWRNKADNCITVWRNVEANTNVVEIHFQKIRFREIGKQGMVELLYDYACGRFHVAPPHLRVVRTGDMTESD